MTKAKGSIALEEWLARLSFVTVIWSARKRLSFVHPDELKSRLRGVEA